MSLTLSTAELAQLESVATTLLSPLSFAHVDEWRAASRHEIQRLLGADSSGSLLPLAGEPYANADPELAAGAVAYETYFHRLDIGLQVVRHDKRLEVFTVHDIYDWAAYKKTEMYADWNHPYRLFDSVAMAVEMGPDQPAASLHFYHEREGGPAFSDRDLALLRLLLPTFRAGVFTLWRLHAHRTALADALDRTGQPVLVADVAGRTVHTTPTLEQLLGQGPGQATVRGALAAVVDLLAARLRRPRPSDTASPEGVRACESEIAIAGQRYRVHGSYIGRCIFGAEPAIVLTLTHVQCTPSTLASDDLCARFRLTAREAEVARLVAERRSAREIAALLDIRYHTARRHVEHVYEKLGVHDRAELAARLRSCTPG